MRQVAHRARYALTAVLVLAALAVVGLPPATATGDGAISGVAFQDENRNGVHDPEEAPFEGHRLYLFRSDGSYVKNAITSTAGVYAFTGLVEGDYMVAYDSSSWSPIKDAWVPTTTGSVWPRISVTVRSSANADFGWRPIAWSTDAASPISAFTAPNGMKILSYNDAVAAEDVYDALMAGLVGDEANTVIVRFAWGATNATSGSVIGTPGSFTDFRATITVTYASWLDGQDQTLSHEYGHAWSLYHAYIVQQDDTFGSYLEARGLTGDPRVNASYGWSARELIAEDYRQLFGSANARALPQANKDLPPASEVAGLRDFLRFQFTSPPASPPSSDEPSTTEAGAMEPLSVSLFEVTPLKVKQKASITYALSTPALGSVEIRYPNGQLVKVLDRERRVAGGERIELSWDKTDGVGRRVKRGDYVVTLTGVADGATVSRSVAITAT